jgi:hypothetical protein
MIRATPREREGYRLAADKARFSMAEWIRRTCEKEAERLGIRIHEPREAA